MNTYNKLMLKFWLIVSIILPIVITYFVYTQGFDKWGSYYLGFLWTKLEPTVGFEV